MSTGSGNFPLHTSTIRSPAPRTPRRNGRKRAYEEAHESDYAVTPSRSAKRRQVRSTIASGNTPVIDLTGGVKSPVSQTTTPRKRRKAADASPVVEKRRRVFRKHAPQTFLTKLERARTQRMFVVDRTREGTEEVPTERVQIVGTTGNIYEVAIELEPYCTCPDSEKGNQCKHIVYVLCNVLKVPDHLQYQLAFLSSELREIFANAPVNPKDNASKENESGKRKPIEGDCPICFMEFEPAREEIVWCKAACGNNIHKTCFEKWAATQSQNGVRCVYCRSNWEVDTSFKQLLAQGKVNEEGYVNVGAQLGLSGIRDYSTYHQWGRRRRRYYSYSYDDYDYDYGYD
ncbi:hypothetical protein AJ79_06064 [Helicocarpus griseus UAMH5409]|uniref:Anaphase-promoting complex subunit 11 n=1 Tax=Helicocarpus griseus UAMH5409 TaxID=1447875 RepID=A0A2B7XI06_9EURO|nr:hypothetical protein AJ79_06064 [Helicocarpus griseus UAMH5409]